MLGIIGTALAGAAEGAGRSAAPLAKYVSDSQLQDEAAKAQALRDARLSELRKGEADYAEGIRQRGVQANIDIETNPDNVAKKGAAAAGLIQAQIPAKVAERKAFADVDTQQKVDEFSRLAPLQREEAIKTAVAKLEALSTPEALAAARKIKLAEHIVDPQYTMIPNADGTVDAVNTRNPAAGVVKLKGSDGQPIIRKDPEELKAATSIINMANSNLRIAEAAYKAGKDDPDPTTKAQAEEAWKQAQAEARRLTAPAYAVLYGKSGATDPGAGVTAPTPQVSVPQGAIAALNANPNLAAEFEKKYGVKASDYLKPKASAPEKSAQRQAGIVQSSMNPESPASSEDNRKARLRDELKTLGNDRASVARRKRIEEELNSPGE